MKRIAVTLWVSLENGADAETVAVGLVDLACAMPEGTDLDEAVESIDHYQWEPADG